ncbi:MAG: hypothetical protein M3076_14145 [Actinomycetota bacterium]|nr:hypothetical protein [Actinomycetota bacterium]
MAIRAGALIVALLACAWFALGIHQAHDTHQASAIVSSAARLSPRQEAHVDALLRSAATLNPDDTLALLRGRAELLAGQPGRAITTLKNLARQEPLNIEAWIWLAEAAGGKGPLYQQAIRHVERLDSQEFKRSR